MAWEQSEGDAAKLSQSGMGGFVSLRGPCPELGEWATRAAHCWHFCAGWAPERWPLYDALHDVPDWHMLIDLMQQIHNHG